MLVNKLFSPSTAEVTKKLTTDNSFNTEFTIVVLNPVEVKFWLVKVPNNSLVLLR